MVLFFITPNNIVPKVNQTTAITTTDTANRRRLTASPVRVMNNQINRASNNPIKADREKEINSILETIMDGVIEVVGAERGFLLLSDEDGRMDFKVARNMDHEKISKPEFKVSNSISRSVIETGLPILTRDAQTDDRFQSKISVLSLKLRSILCVPLKSPQGVIGAVYVDNRFVSDLFNEENLELLNAFAHQAAVAIENARLHQELLSRQGALKEAHDQVRDLNARLEEKVVSQSLELDQERKTRERQEAMLSEKYSYHNIIGQSEPIRNLFAVLDQVRFQYDIDKGGYAATIKRAREYPVLK